MTMIDTQVSQCMNDILNQVESREWKRVTQQRDVLLRRNKRQSKQIKSMEDDWQVATEKIGQENSDLHNEIKKLKDELRVKHPVIFQKTYQQQRDEIEKLKLELKAVKDANVMFMKRYEKKVEDEKKIDEVCSRIQCEDTFGHLIGRIPTEESSDSDSDSDDDELDECFCCGKRFDSHNARYNMGESLRLKYQKYYGSENDDGDICPACIIPRNY